MHDRRGVEQLSADGDGQAEHVDRGGVGGLAGEALELAPLAVEKAAPLHEILRRIAADDLLGKGGDGDVGVRHLARERDQRDRRCRARRRPSG